MSNSDSGSGGKKTLVEQGTHFKGSFSSSCPVEVRGVVEGDVQAPALTVSAEGAVKGKVRVSDLRSDGELAGEFDADVVRLAGTVRDNTVIRAKSLEVKLAPERGRMQVIFGECELEVGDPAHAERGKAAPADEAVAAAPPPAAPEPRERKRSKNERSNSTFPPPPMGDS
jgi:cytoskeletal protein CcmA (bactofilin family)